MALRTWVVVVALSLVFAVAFGFNYGLSNQNTYLIGGLRLAYPDLLAKDWLATQTTNYQKFFAYPAALLFRLGHSGWPFAIANVLMLIAGALTIFLIVRRVLGQRHAVAAFVLVLAFCLATGTFSVSESYLYSPYLQPSTIGVVGLLLACLLFLRGKYFFSGLALAIGGLFHANYLLLGFPLLVVAHLLVSRERLAQRFAWQFAMPVLALAPLVPTILSVAGVTGSAAGTNILLTIRSPWHYQPAYFWRDFLPFAAWLALLVVAFPRKETSLRRFSPGMALTWALVFLIGAATLLTTAVYIPSVAQAYVWRVAPVLVLLIQVYAMRALLRALTGEAYDGFVRPVWLRAALLLISAGLFLGYYVHYERSAYAPVLLVLFLAVTLSFAVAVSRSCRSATSTSSKSWPVYAPAALALSFVVLYLAYHGHPEPFPRSSLAVLLVLVLLLGAVILTQRRRSLRFVPRDLILVVTVAAFIITGVWQLAELRSDSNLLHPRPTADQTLYTWARTTDRNAVFLIPPQMDDFRLQSERAVVVDWKSTPFVPSELVQWYARITDISGGVAPTSEQQASAGYAHLNTVQLGELAGRYSVEYALAELPTRWSPPTSWTVAFRNHSYEVWRVASLE